MSLEIRPQATVFNASSVPSAHQERQMVDGLRAAWTLPTNKVIYAHPERFEDGAITAMIREERASAVVLHEGEGVLGWAALVKHPGIGNVEIGSVNAAPGNGTPLVEEIYRRAEGDPDQEILFFDVATCRTAMEGAAIKAADRTNLRIPVVTYIDPPVWGDREEGTTWGAFGLFAISRSSLEKNGPIELPKLSEDHMLADGTEDIIANIIQAGNIEGNMRGVTVFGARNERPAVKKFESSEMTEGLIMVDYFDVEKRSELARDGYKPCGIEIGKKEGELTMGVHYSPFDPRESAHGKHTELISMEHPTRTITLTTAMLAEAVRMRAGIAYPLPVKSA